MEPTTPVDEKLADYYETEAAKYLMSLPPSHYMEATPQATQREITLESFALVRAMRPDVQCFNELLVQYRRGKRKKLGKVVPDNMIVVHPKPIEAVGSYDMEVQPVGPVLVLEYVSKHSERKDYDENYEKYEEELKVPYYLIFYPDADEVTLFKLGEKGYVAVHPNAAGRLAITELELEAALHEGWVRFWFRGELLPLPGDLLKERDAERVARQAAEQRAATAEAELAKVREELARAKKG